MKTLLILRHAKSSWKEAHVSDFERGLNGRGRRAAKAIGMFIREKGVNPEFVLSSPAARATETLAIVLDAAELKVDFRYDQQLYLASCDWLLHVVSQLPDDKAHVMLIGHNPGLEQLLKHLTGLSEHLPTGALAKIVLDVAQWKEIPAAKTGYLEWLIRPRELPVR